MGDFGYIFGYALSLSFMVGTAFGYLIRCLIYKYDERHKDENKE